jgi:uncharacterized coiled-coil protein SlyX
VTLLLALVVVAAGYAFHEHRIVGSLATENSDVIASLDKTRSQLADLTGRLNQMEARASAPAAKPAAAHRAAGKPATRLHGGEDPRWKQLQQQLASQQQQIDANRDALGQTRTELQGSIARTHDELVALEKKGERNYFEFDIDKNDQFQRQGAIAVKLRKANTKHQYADLELMVDDFKLSQKHVNLYQPVTFYAGDSKQAVELVINHISKDHIHGYVSQPKYKPSELEVAANPADGNASGANAIQPRQRLEPPKY